MAKILASILENFIFLFFDLNNQRNVLSPNTNGDGVLGTDSFRWSYLYTTHAVDVSSDKKLKDHIEYLSEDVNLENFFDSL